jgi:hypothetical protein
MEAIKALDVIWIDDTYILIVKNDQDLIIYNSQHEVLKIINHLPLLNSRNINYYHTVKVFNNRLILRDLLLFHPGMLYILKYDHDGNTTIMTSYQTDESDITI